MTTEIDAKIKAATNLLVESIIQAKSIWLDSIMSKVLPKDVYQLSKSGKNRDRMKLSRWLAKNGFEIKEGDGFSRVVVNKVLISEWKFRVENGKVEQSIKTIGPDELEWSAMVKILSAL